MGIYRSKQFVSNNIDITKVVIIKKVKQIISIKCLTFCVSDVIDILQLISNYYCRVYPNGFNAIFMLSIIIEAVNISRSHVVSFR